MHTFPFLIQAARPDLYRANAFRVTGLRTDVTPREIARQLDQVRLMSKLGHDVVTASPLPLESPPGPEAVAEAMDRLRDPERRLVDEFFWFWPQQPGQGQNETALQALTLGDVVGAERSWREAVQHGPAPGVARHNLAVLAHAVALDLEHRADSGVALTRDQVQARDVCWADAMQHWRAVHEDDDVWRRLADRVRELNEPQLTADTVEDLRAGLPAAVLSVNGQLALRAAEQGRQDEAARHVAIVRSSGFEAEVIEEVLGQAARPVRERIHLLCEKAETETEANPENGIAIARNLIETSRPPLAVMDALLPAHHAVRVVAHDEVALKVLGCLASFTNKTGTMDGVAEPLAAALGIAESESERSRFQENLETVRRNQQASVCWFCQENPPEPGASFGVPMHGNITRTPVGNGYQVRWQYLTVHVPRCSRCRQAHRRSERQVLVGGFLGGLLGLGGCAAVTQATGAWFGGLLVISALILIGGLVGALVGKRRLPEGVRGESHKTEFPAIRDLLAQGWAYGNKPSTG